MRVGRALTSQLARKPVGTGLADGRPEEFAAGRPVGCERVPFSSQRGEAMEQQLSSCHGHGPRLGDQRPPRQALGDPLGPVGFRIHTCALCCRVVIPALGRWRIRNSRSSSPNSKFEARLDHGETYLKKQNRGMGKVVHIFNPSSSGADGSLHEFETSQAYLVSSKT